MRMGQGVRTGLGHGGITCVLQTQFSSFFFVSYFFFTLLPQCEFNIYISLRFSYFLPLLMSSVQASSALILFDASLTVGGYPYKHTIHLVTHINISKKKIYHVNPNKCPWSEKSTPCLFYEKKKVKLRCQTRKFQALGL